MRERLFKIFQVGILGFGLVVGSVCPRSTNLARAVTGSINPGEAIVGLSTTPTLANWDYGVGAFDQGMGTLYLGKTSRASGGAYSLVCCAMSGAQINAAPLAYHSDLNGKNFRNLAIANYGAKRILVCSVNATPGSASRSDSKIYTLDLSLKNTADSPAVPKAFSVLDGAAAAGTVDKLCVVYDSLGQAYVVASIFPNAGNTLNASSNSRIFVYKIDSDGTLTNVGQLRKVNPANTSGVTGLSIGLTGVDGTTTFSLSTTDNLAAYVGAAHIGDLVGCKELFNVGSMHWDSSLQRLFIGFDRRDAVGDAEPIAPFLVCKLSPVGSNVHLDAVGLANLVSYTGVTAATSNIFNSIRTGSESDSDTISTTNQRIVAFKRSGLGNTGGFSVRHIKTMHVTPAKTTVGGILADAPVSDYLITHLTRDEWDDFASPNGSAHLKNYNKRIYCLPLVGKNAVDQTKVGTVADYTQYDLNNGFVTQPTNISGMYPAANSNLATATPAYVGCGPLPTATSHGITGLEVVGNTVFASIGQANNDGGDGVWSSTAILDQRGVVQGWTPWSKFGVAWPMGRFNCSTEALGGTQDLEMQGFYRSALFADTTNGAFWMVHRVSNNYSNGTDQASRPACGITVATTEASSGVADAVLGNIGTSNIYPGNSLSVMMAKMRDVLGGVVTFIKSFAVRRTEGLGASSLLVAANSKGVWISNTGTLALVTGTADQEVFGQQSVSPLSESTFNASMANYNAYFAAPEDMGVVNAAAWSQSVVSGANHGWLFLGTENGLWVLSNADGSGLSSTANNTALANMGTTTTGLTLKKLSWIDEPVIGLATAGDKSVNTNAANRTPAGIGNKNHLFILTRKNLYKVDLFQDDYKATSPTVPVLGGSVAPNTLVRLRSFEAGSAPMFLKLMPSVSRAADFGVGKVCGVVACVSGLYVMTDGLNQTPANVWLSGSITGAPDVPSALFGGSGTLIHNVELLPVNPWYVTSSVDNQTPIGSTFGQNATYDSPLVAGTASLGGTIANVIVTTGSLFPFNGSDVWVLPLYGKSTALLSPVGASGFISDDISRQSSLMYQITAVQWPLKLYARNSLSGRLVSGTSLPFVFNSYDDGANFALRMATCPLPVNSSDASEEFHSAVTVGSHGALLQLSKDSVTGSTIVRAQQ